MDPVRQLPRPRFPEVGGRIVEAVRQCGEKPIDQHQADVCFDALTALNAESEASAILFDRTEKAFDGDSAVERVIECILVEVDVVFFNGVLDPEHDIEGIGRVPWVVRADRQDLPVYTSVVKLQCIER